MSCHAGSCTYLGTYTLHVICCKCRNFGWIFTKLSCSKRINVFNLYEQRKCLFNYIMKKWREVPTTFGRKIRVCIVLVEMLKNSEHIGNIIFLHSLSLSAVCSVYAFKWLYHTWKPFYFSCRLPFSLLPSKLKCFTQSTVEKSHSGLLKKFDICVSVHFSHSFSFRKLFLHILYHFASSV